MHKNWVNSSLESLGKRKKPLVEINTIQVSQGRQLQLITDEFKKKKVQTHDQHDQSPGGRGDKYHKPPYPEDSECRIIVAHKMQNWSKNWRADTNKLWNKVEWTAEKKNLGKPNVQRNYYPKGPASSVKHGGGSVMAWEHLAASATNSSLLMMLQRIVAVWWIWILSGYLQRSSSNFINHCFICKTMTPNARPTKPKYPSMETSRLVNSKMKTETMINEWRPNSWMKINWKQLQWKPKKAFPKKIAHVWWWQ